MKFEPLPFGFVECTNCGMGYEISFPEIEEAVECH